MPASSPSSAPCNPPPNFGKVAIMARGNRAATDAMDNGAGHNSNGTIDAGSLESYVDRAASVMKEQKQLGEALKAICAEGDESGVASKKEIRELARESLMDPDVLHAKLDRMDTLRHALGEFVRTPLGAAAQAAATRQ